MSPLTESPFHIQRILKILFVIVIGGVLLGYMYFQARNLIAGPSIALTADIPIVHHERMVMIEGKTQNITSLTLNGKPIFTDESGAFKRMLVLENGYTIMTLEAHDRYGRSTTLSRTFVYVPTSS